MSTVDVKNEKYFIKIKEVINNLRQSGMIDAGSGYCLSMSDVIHKLLYKEGIKSEVVECSLMVMLKDPPGLYLVGYPGFHENNYNSDKKMENHVVCITKTKIPILIDLSINHIDKSVEYICEPILTTEEHTDIAEFRYQNSTWTYQKRPETALPKLYQKSILERIKTDVHFESEIKFIKTFLFIMFTVSFLNFSRGIYDFYLTFIKPSQVEHIKK